MIERGSGVRFTHKPLDRRRVLRAFFGKDFNRHVAPEPRIAGAINFAHPARADGGLQFVMTEIFTDIQHV